MSAKHFPTNLKTRRKRLGWTQGKVAEKLSRISGKEIKRTTYRTWETGDARPSIDMLPRISEILLIDDLYLFLTKS